MSQEDNPRDRWARLRFAIIGPLLAAPPERGDLYGEILRLANKIWRHPSSGEPIRFAASTIERWYYTARNERTDPVGALRQRVRQDAGQHSSLNTAFRQVLHTQYRAHPSWSYQLHADNLAVLATEDPTLGPMPSYASVRRYMKAHGLVRRRRLTSRKTPGAEAAETRLEQREVRSFEADYVHGLWHLDFHHGSRKVLTRQGHWTKPLLLGVLDDRSRLCCHPQWYLDETAETLAHGLGQAFQKRALPRALMTDNGAAMIAEETKQGLHDLGIVHYTTLPYSPYQNAKQEVFWASVEGRLMAMLEGIEQLTLELLNEATQAWVEMEYHRSVHSEIGDTPLNRYLTDPNVGRESPNSDTLRRAFRAEATRTQRRSDGTIALLGRRFEIPSRYANIERVRVRYARWDLGAIDLVDPHTGQILCALYPVDKSANANAVRRRREPLPETLPENAPLHPAPAIAPLLKKLIAEYAATGLPPAYLPRPYGKEIQETNR